MDITNGDANGRYDVVNQIKFKTIMLKSSLRDCSDRNILVKGTITITEVEAEEAARQADEEINE